MRYKYIRKGEVYSVSGKVQRCMEEKLKNIYKHANYN